MVDAVVEGVRFLLNLWPGATMDCTIDATTSYEFGVGSVNNDVHLESGDVGSNNWANS